jgi:Phosphoribosyl transferase domain
MTTSHASDGAARVGYALIRDMAFASCYVYSPTGAGARSVRSRVLCSLLKGADRRFILKVAGQIRRQVAGTSLLSGYLGPNDLLIPIPGNAPAVPGFRPVAERLAIALAQEGLGGRVWGGLHRIWTVPKSGTAMPGARPSVGAHFASLSVDPDALANLAGQRVVLIDDVVTKGRTLLAAAARIREALPDAEISAFAFLRTMGFVQEVDRLLDPCVGEIRWRAGDAQRTP